MLSHLGVLISFLYTKIDILNVKTSIGNRILKYLYYLKNEINIYNLYEKNSIQFKLLNKRSKFMNIEYFNFHNWYKHFTFAPRILDAIFEFFEGLLESEI